MKAQAAIIIYDTETTGLPDFKAPSSAPHQPHIVQLAAVLVDADTRNKIADMALSISDKWRGGDHRNALALYRKVSIMEEKLYLWHMLDGEKDVDGLKLRNKLKQLALGPERFD